MGRGKRGRSALKKLWPPSQCGRPNKRRQRHRKRKAESTSVVSVEAAPAKEPAKRQSPSAASRSVGSAPDWSGGNGSSSEEIPTSGAQAAAPTALSAAACSSGVGSREPPVGGSTGDSGPGAGGSIGTDPRRPQPALEQVLRPCAAELAGRLWGLARVRGALVAEDEIEDAATSPSWVPAFLARGLAPLYTSSKARPPRPPPSGAAAAPSAATDAEQRSAATEPPFMRPPREPPPAEGATVMAPKMSPPPAPPPCGAMALSSLAQAPRTPPYPRDGGPTSVKATETVAAETSAQATGGTGGSWV